MEQEFKKQRINSPYNILIRRESAKYNRESQRIKKEQAAISRTFRHSERKLRAAQRGIDSLLGRTSCINQDNILYEHNQPGFCYRRNGEPRLPTSLAESKTRRIVHDMDGREGILPELASNVVSDNPIMAEILSEPEIVSLLCDLRTTSALMDNKKLFDQFALAMLHNVHTPLPFKTQLGEDPMACLRHYRTNLIQELLDSLQRQADARLRRGAAKADRALKYLLALPKEEGQDGASPMERVFGGEKAPMTLEEWNDALLARLRAAQQERFRKRFRAYSTDVTPDSGNSNPTTTTSASTTYIRQQMRGFGLRGIQSLRKVTASNYGFRKFSKPSAIPSESKAPTPASNNANSSEKYTPGYQTPWSPGTGDDIGPTPTTSNSLSYSSKMTAKMKKNREELKRRYRGEFDSFVKSLIAEVEDVAAVGNTINEIRRKNPARTRPTTRPLVKLLQKKSLFSSLNEDDLIFYDFAGGRVEAEKELAHELHLPENKPVATYLKPGGFTFHVPSRALSAATVTNTIPVDSEADREAALAALTSVGPSSPISRASTASPALRRAGTASGKASSSECCQLRSLKRVCCAACSAKLRDQCRTVRDRDRKDQMLTELAPWKGPGNSDQWTKNYTPALQSVKQHLLSGIPISLRKSYNMYTDQPIAMAGDPENSTMDARNINSMFKPQQTDGLPTPPSQIDSPMPGQRGAPTPMLPRRKFLPGFSAYSSIPHTPPKSALQRTARMFTKRGNQSKNAISAKMTPVNNNTNPGERGADSSTSGRDREAFQRKPEAWTLRVSKLDLLRLKHELQSESIRGRIHDFHKELTLKNEEMARDSR